MTNLNVASCNGLLEKGVVQSEDYRLTGSPGFPGTETGGYVGRPVAGAEGGAAATGTGGGTAAAGGAGRPLSPRFNRFRASLEEHPFKHRNEAKLITGMMYRLSRRDYSITCSTSETSRNMQALNCVCM